jgi:hypothetical protein
MKKKLFSLTIGLSILTTLLAFSRCDSIPHSAKAAANQLGLYCYTVPFNLRAEDRYILLREINGVTEGYFYGTTDEFTDMREGFLCGYMVLPLDSLRIDSDSISFVLHPEADDFFMRPIERDILSTEDAKKAGYVHWPQYDSEFIKYYTERKVYKGVFVDSTTIQFKKGKNDYEAKVFVKVNAQQDDDDDDDQPDLYINGKSLPVSLIKTLNASAVEEVRVIKDAAARNKNGEIHVTLKSSYQLQTISLSRLKEKHISRTDSTPCLFFIDNELIETNSYDGFVCDAAQIERVFVQRFDNPDANIHLNLVKIRLRAKRNQQVMIRHSAKPAKYKLGWYHYTAPFKQSYSDSYILLREVGGIAEGYFYGTTDEFNDQRYAYLPGYMVLPMDSLRIDSDSISFVLHPKMDDFFTQPIERNILSTEEAKKAGCIPWIEEGVNPLGYKEYYTTRKVYRGVFEDLITIRFEKGENDHKAKVFTKTDM